LPDWERVSMVRHAEKWYGRQKGFRRIIQATDEDDL